MIDLLRRAGRWVPSLLLSFALAVAVWISAVTSADPNEVRVFGHTIPVEILGQDPGLVLVYENPLDVVVTLNAPSSTWDRLNSEDGLVRAVADFSGLGAGTHNVEVEVQLSLRTAKLVSVSPRLVNITLENLATRSMQINLSRNGEPAIGFQLEAPVLSQETVLVSGPESQVARVRQVRAALDLAGAHENINTTLRLQALDLNEEVVDRVTLNPERVTVVQAITQRGGFRSDLVIKPVYTGNLASGYRLTNISVFPPAVTVFSSNPARVNDLPGYIETQSINLQGASDDLEIEVQLDLPEGVTLVGDQKVVVQVGIAAIESSITINNLAVQVDGLAAGLRAGVEPGAVSLILGGPLPVLDALGPTEIRVYVDAAGLSAGVYQLKPQVEITVAGLQVISILPEMVEVTIQRGSPTPSPTPTKRP